MTSTNLISAILPLMCHPRTPLLAGERTVSAAANFNVVDLLIKYYVSQLINYVPQPPGGWLTFRDGILTR